MPGSRQAFVLRPTSDTHRVTNIELFYDLVFVFALTQITSMIGADPTVERYVQGAVILAMVWFGWCAYTWLGNQAHADQGMMRGCMLTVLIGMFFVAIAIPRTFEENSSAMVFVVAYILVRSTHIAVYWLAAAGDRDLRAQLVRTYSSCLAASAFWFAGAVVHDNHTRLGLWFIGAAIDFLGVFFTSRNPGWRLTASAHFAERHGLIVIIAIGESLVSIGVGISDRPLSWHAGAGILFGLFSAIALWWLYFDVLVYVAEQSLHRLQGAERVKLARDSFTYLHLPIVTGIVLSALGLKFGLGEHHEHGPGSWSLFGGSALYLVGLSALRRRNIGGWNLERLATAAALLVLAPFAGHLDGLGQIALVAAVLVALVIYEGVTKRDLRREIRTSALG